ncbi:MAG: DUF5074 domain-containing protein [Bacteroidia bacterium]
MVAAVGTARIPTKNASRLASAAILFCSFLAACQKKPRHDLPPPEPAYTGTFILCEGQWTHNNARLDVWDDAGKLHTEVFYRVNQTRLGDVANSYLVDKDTLYLVMNHSRLLYKIQLPSLKLLGTLSFPPSASLREMILVADTEAWVNSLTNGTIYRLNPRNMQLTPPHITIENYSESMIRWKNKVFVTCGNYAYPLRNNKIARLTLPERSLRYLETPIENPGPIVEGPDGAIWVGCRGNYSTTGACLVKLNPQEERLQDTLFLPCNLYDMKKIGDYIVFLSDSGISAYRPSDATLTMSFIPRAQIGAQPEDLLYAVAYDSLMRRWLVANAKQGALPAEIVVLDEQKKPQQRFTTGLFPGNIFFYRK